MKASKKWAEVAVDRPLDRFFTYHVPEELRDRVQLRSRVQVPFGRSCVRGVVVDFSGPPPGHIRTKDILELLDDRPLISPELYELLVWVSDYYGNTLGEVIANCVPFCGGQVRRHVVIRPAVPAAVLEEEIRKRSKKAPAQARILAHCVGDPKGTGRPALLRNANAGHGALKKLIEEKLLVEVREDESAFLGGGTTSVPEADALSLSDEQQRALCEINEAIAAGGFSPFLLFGVTGSGKTEIYIRALEEAIREGGQGLVMLPEIALTPQTFQRFACRFKEVVVLHSMLSPAQRGENMRKAAGGEAQVVIGARSAVFAPFADLRLIVVDEEHETAFKQESVPRYNGRDVAVYRAMKRGIPVVLGSATPSLESYQNAASGRYRMLVLSERVTEQKKNAVRLVDLSRSKRKKRWLSPELVDLTAGTLSAGRQAIFFLNRRGFSPFVKCVQCGYNFPCPECDVSMTYHRRGNLFLCHSCGHVQPRTERCPQCSLPVLRFSGAGTERIAAELGDRFPRARIGRLDRDVASSRKNLFSIVNAFASKELDILVGTQMVTKGHDFPGVTLIGIICADMALNMPDFRASERTFQLVHQVAGRAGRGRHPGTVVIQTFVPNNRIIKFALEGDYRGFAEEETQRRKPLLYPPFGRLLRVVLRGVRESQVKDAAQAAAEALKAVKGRVLGPAPCPVARKKKKLRYQVIFKSPNPADVHRALVRVRKLKLPGRVEAYFDVDPFSFM